VLEDASKKMVTNPGLLKKTELAAKYPNEQQSSMPPQLIV
jgi:hypothetical protein